MSGQVYGDVSSITYSGTLSSRATNVAIATAITSYVRVKLYNAIDAFHSEGFEVLYCNTDSLYIDQCKDLPANLVQMLDNEKLGYLKNDTTHKDPSAFISEMIINGAKSYALNLNDNSIKICHKGLPIKQLNIDPHTDMEIMPLAEAKNQQYDFIKSCASSKQGQEKLTVPISKMFTHKIFSHNVEPTLERYTSVSIRCAYTKRLVNEDGSTSPKLVELKDSYVP